MAIGQWIATSSKPGVIGTPLQKLRVLDPNFPVPTLLQEVWDYLVDRGGLEEEGILRLAPDAMLVSRAVLHIDAFQASDVIPIREILDAVAASADANLSITQSHAANRGRGVYNPAAAAAAAAEHVQKASAAHLAAHIFKLVLRSLPSQLLVDALHIVAPPSGRLPTGWTSEQMRAAVFAAVAEHRKQTVLRWFLDCCVHIVRKAESNRMQPRSLAVIVAPVLLNPNFGLGAEASADQASTLSLRLTNLVTVVTMLLEAHVEDYNRRFAVQDAHATSEQREATPINHAISKSALDLLKEQLRRPDKQPATTARTSSPVIVEASEAAADASASAVAVPATSVVVPTASVESPASAMEGPVPTPAARTVNTDPMLDAEPGGHAGEHDLGTQGATVVDVGELVSPATKPADAVATPVVATPVAAQVAAAPVWQRPSTTDSHVPAAVEFTPVESTSVNQTSTAQPTDAQVARAVPVGEGQLDPETPPPPYQSPEVKSHSTASVATNVAPGIVRALPLEPASHRDQPASSEAAKKHPPSAVQVRVLDSSDDLNSMEAAKVVALQEREHARHAAGLANSKEENVAVDTNNVVVATAVSEPIPETVDSELRALRGRYGILARAVDSIERKLSEGQAADGKDGASAGGKFQVTALTILNGKITSLIDDKDALVTVDIQSPVARDHAKKQRKNLHDQCVALQLRVQKLVNAHRQPAPGST